MGAKETSTARNLGNRVSGCRYVVCTHYILVLQQVLSKSNSGVGRLLSFIFQFESVFVPYNNKCFWIDLV